MKIVINDEERDIILAALRYWQESPEEPSPMIMDIATNDEEHDPLSDDDIDDLCERINCNDA